jgi:long-chain acyl-CoA synthetase
MTGDAAHDSSSAAAYGAVSREATRHDTVLRRFLTRAHETPSRVALRVLAAGGAPADAAFTWGEWATASRAAAAALVADGVAVGDAVAVLAGNRPLWPIAEYGALMAGAVSAGLFPTCTSAQLEALLADCRPPVVIVDTAFQLDKVISVLTRAASLGEPPAGVVRTVVCDDERAATAAARGCSATEAGVRVLSWRAWLAEGSARLADAAVAREVDARTADASPERIAGLIYTSGSTGEPKGACVSHAYYLASAESIASALGLGESDTSLAPLPFAHAAERVFGLHTRVATGMEAGLVLDAARLWDAARAYRPTLFGGLPRLYEKLHEAVLAAVARGEDARAALAAMLGGRVRVATSGGAPLPRAVAEALDALGLPVLGAYGQTEHLCVAMHRPRAHAFDSAGLPMPGTEVRLAPDGELLVRRNALTFSGYLNKPEATRAAFTDDGAWLRTGDTAELDAGGRIRITGRIKEILALSTGKKVAPLPIERRLAEHPAVDQAVVLGEGRRHAVALLFVRDGAAAEGSPARAAVDAHVAALNATLAPHEQVRRWAVVAAELTEADGALTPTLKVRRAVVAARYARLIEELYA